MAFLPTSNGSTMTRERVTMNKKLSAAVGMLAVASMALAGCGSSNGSAADTSDDGKLMTVQVFDSLANQAGIAKGWAAKLIQKKFNIKLNLISPNVSGGGDTLFDTRSAAGNLGDIIITGTGGGRLSKLVKSNLIADMTPYMKGMTYLNKYKASSDAVEKIAGKKGIWGFGEDVSSQSPDKPSEGVEPAAAPYIMWNYYKEIGYPKIANLDDFIKVLKQMQDKARQDTGKNDIYAISLFKDWDGSGMQNPQAMTGWYGYWNQGSAFAKADGSDKQTVLTKNGTYQQMLDFLHKASAAGIVDPESTTQSWDNLSTKVTNGKVLMSIWSWLGKPRQNSDANKEKGVGFMLAPLENMKVYSAGFTPAGNVGTVISLGAKAKNKQRLVKFINWLYSPEGVYASAANSGGAACPKDMCWTVKNGKPELNEFGTKAMFDANGLNVPSEFGGGSYNDGIMTLNFPTVSPNDIDPSTGYTYNPQLWPQQLNKETALDRDWQAHMGGAKTDIEYLQKNHKLDVRPGASYSAPEEDSQISAIRSQINTQVVQHSWKAAMAKSDSDFNKEISEMIKNADGLGFSKIQKIDYAAIDGYMAATK